MKKVRLYLSEQKKGDTNAKAKVSLFLIYLMIKNR